MSGIANDNAVPSAAVLRRAAKAGAWCGRAFVWGALAAWLVRSVVP